MLYVFYQTLDENKPKWQLDNGLIGANPGLGFRPMPPESNVESTLVWFEAANEKNTEYWIGALDEFLYCTFFNFHYLLICLINIAVDSYLQHTRKKTRKPKKIVSIATSPIHHKTEKCVASMLVKSDSVSVPKKENMDTASHPLVFSWNWIRWGRVYSYCRTLRFGRFYCSIIYFSSDL